MITSIFVIVDTSDTLACGSCATFWLACSRLQDGEENGTKKAKTARGLERESCFSLAFRGSRAFYARLHLKVAQNAGDTAPKIQPRESLPGLTISALISSKTSQKFVFSLQ